MITYDLGTLTFNADAATFDQSGNLFRLIPHGSNDPLTAIHSLRGGRWNAENTIPTLYAFTDPGTAGQYLRAQEAIFNFSWDEVQPNHQKDLLVFDWSISGLADVATSAGLAMYQLPDSYPTGFEFPTAWVATQPIGHRIYEAGMPGLVARSASVRDFSASIIHWAEVAVFPGRARVPKFIARIPFADWYRRES